MLSLFAAVKARFARVPVPVTQSVTQSVAVSTPSVSTPHPAGFEVQLDGVKFNIPANCVVRQHRMEGEAILFVLIYRRFNRANRYISLHGKVRSELHARSLPMLSIEIDGMSDDQLLLISREDATAVLYAVRNPVECPTIEVDFASNVVPVAVPAAPPALDSFHSAVVDANASLQATRLPPDVPAPVTADPAPAIAADQSQVEASPGAPIWTLEGRFDCSGVCAYEHPKTGKKGKPAFHVTIIDKDGNVKSVWGSYLQNALRNARVLPGDIIRLVKYSQVPVNIGHRTVRMNYWEVERLHA